MRRITSKEEIKKKENRNRTVMGIVLAAILLLSTAGYFVSDFTGGKQGKTVYNKIEFNQDDYGYWHFTLNGKEYVTMVNPYHAENITVDAAKSLGDYNGKPLYFEASSSQFGIYEISRNIGDIVQRVNYACMDENCSEYAIKDCTSNVISIKIADGNESSVTAEENCVTINYAPGEEERAVDAFIFRLLGLK